MGIDEEQAACSLRFGLSRFTTAEEVTAATTLIAGSVTRVRYRQAEVSV